MDNIIVLLDATAAKFAYLALLVLIAKFVTRLLAKKNNPFFVKLDRTLMKVHKPASAVLIILGTLHAVLSIYSIPELTILPWLLGLICLISCIGAVASFILKKKMANPKRWLTIHRISTVVALITLFAHMILARML